MVMQYSECGLEDRSSSRRLEEGPSHPSAKKGSTTQCTNYCGIDLLSLPGKVYAKILGNRVGCITEAKVVE